MHGQIKQNTKRLEKMGFTRRGARSRARRGAKRGASLIIALGIITIITLLGIGISSYVVSGLKDSANIARSNETYYAAEGALEAGLLVNAQKGAGYSTNGLQPAYFGKYVQCGANNSDCLARTPKYKIQGQVEKAFASGAKNGWYSIPAPGTGNVGTGCDPLNPPLGLIYFNKGDGKFYSTNENNYDAVEPEDNPCNWNKIKPGESVNIPLYYTQEDGTAVNILDANSAFELRVRTACETDNASHYCLTRPGLDLNKGNSDYGYDDPIMNWQITATDKNDAGKNYVLSAVVNYDSKAQWADSSIITESKINVDPVLSNMNLKKYLGVDSSRCKGLIINFLTGADQGTCAINNIHWKELYQNIAKPNLKISVIHSLDNSGGGTVPYLEYQFLVQSAQKKPTDAFQQLSSEAFSGSFKQNLEAKIPQDGSALEYVIQQ